MFLYPDLAVLYFFYLLLLVFSLSFIFVVAPMSHLHLCFASSPPKHHLHYYALPSLLSLSAYTLPTFLSLYTFMLFIHNSLFLISSYRHSLRYRPSLSTRFLHYNLSFNSKFFRQCCSFLTAAYTLLNQHSISHLCLHSPYIQLLQLCATAGSLSAPRETHPTLSFQVYMNTFS